jgi:hypothetical protein
VGTELAMRNAKRKIFSLDENIEKPSQTRSKTRKRRRYRKLKASSREFFPDKSLYWYEATDSKYGIPRNLFGMWKLCKMDNPPLKVAVSKIAGAGFGIIRNPNFCPPSADKFQFCLPFDNMVRVKYNSPEYNNAKWSIQIKKKAEYWVENKSTADGPETRTTNPIPKVTSIAIANLINHPIRSKTPVLADSGQDLTKSNCELVVRPYPHMKVSLLPENYEYLCSYRLLDEDRNRKRTEESIDKLKSTRTDNLVHGKRKRSKEDSTNNTGAIQMMEAQTLKIEADHFVYPPTPTQRGQLYPLQLQDHKLIRAWSASHLNKDHLRALKTELQHKIDYASMQYVYDSDLLPKDNE